MATAFLAVACSLGLSFLGLLERQLSSSGLISGGAAARTAPERAALTPIGGLWLVSGTTLLVLSIARAVTTRGRTLLRLLVVFSVVSVTVGAVTNGWIQDHEVWRWSAADYAVLQSLWVSIPLAATFALFERAWRDTPQV